MTACAVPVSSVMALATSELSAFWKYTRIRDSGTPLLVTVSITVGGGAGGASGEAASSGGGGASGRWPTLLSLPHATRDNHAIDNRLIGTEHSQARRPGLGHSGSFMETQPRCWRAHTRVTELPSARANSTARRPRGDRDRGRRPQPGHLRGARDHGARRRAHPA